MAAAPADGTRCDRPARLKARRDFLRVANARRKWVTPGFILQVAPTPADADAASGDATDLASPRVGFTTSRKVGNAVERNRARRRLRAVADQALPHLAKPGHDYVFIGRAGTTTQVPFDQLLHDLRWALKRLGALRGRDDGNGTKVDRP